MAEGVERASRFTMRLMLTTKAVNGAQSMRQPQRSLHDTLLGNLDDCRCLERGLCSTLMLPFYFSRNGNEWGKEMADRIKGLSAQFMAERHALLGFIYGMVRDLAGAEDILQEVWLRLANAAERDEPIENPSRWCRGVAKNLILHYWRERQAAKVVADSELLDLVEQAMNETEDPWAERRQALMECIDLLPQRSKRLLHLKYDRGLTFAAMADLLRRTKDSLKMALCRLREALLECAERKLRRAE
jgi:RNA polymerase sigma factor (sigma-70 family)